MSFSSNTGITANGIANTIISSLDTSLFNISNAPAGNDLINAISKGINDTANTLSASFNSIIGPTTNTAIISNLKVDKWGRVTITVPDISVTGVVVPQNLVLSTNNVIQSDGSLVAYLYADWSPPPVDTGFDHFVVLVHNYDSITNLPVTHVTTGNHYEQIVPAVTLYGVQVQSVDIFLSRTNYCNEEFIITAGDDIAPISPFDVALTSFTGMIRLNWSHGGELDLSHFDVYASQTNDILTATKIGSGVKDYLGDWAQFSWDPGDYNTWYFWIYAVDTSQNYSSVSTVVSGSKTKITGTNIEDLSIWTQALANNAITTAKILAGAVTDLQLANNAVTTAKVAVGAIDTIALANNAITTAKILAGAVDTLQIANNAITTGLIALGAITDTVIANNAITTPKIAANAVTANNILAGTISSTQIAANTIVAGNIAASTISGDKIVGSSITGDKIAGNTITAGNILAGTISSTQIAANTILAGNIAASTISGDKIVGSSITGDKIAGNTITAGNISSNTITADNILTGTITALKIATGTITGDKISGNTIAGSNIIGTTITGDKIAALAITSDKISVTNLAAINANMGAITAGTLTSTNWNGTQGSYFNMNTGVLQIGGSSAPKFNFDGTNLSLNVDTFKISNASTNVFTVEGGLVRIDGNFIVNGTTNTVAIADNAITGMVTAYSSTSLMPSITWFTYVSGNYQYFHTFADSQTYTNHWEDATFYSNLREQTIQQCSITSTGGPIYITISLYSKFVPIQVGMGMTYAGNILMPRGKIIIRRGSTEIWKHDAQDGTNTFAFSDFPNAGTYTYTAYLQDDPYEHNLDYDYGIHPSHISSFMVLPGGTVPTGWRWSTYPNEPKFDSDFNLFQATNGHTWKTGQPVGSYIGDGVSSCIYFKERSIALIELKK